jgi:Ca2+-binding EF-hand superfamily protein
MHRSERKHGRKLLAEKPSDVRQSRDIELIGQAFRLLDKDGSGCLEYDELREALSLLGMPGWSLNESRRIIAKMDANSDGNVDFDEFYKHAMSSVGLRANLSGAIKKMINEIAEVADSDDEDSCDYHLGDRVSVDYQGKGMWYEGTVVAKRYDSDTGQWDYDIVLDIGGKDFYVESDKIERLDTTLRRQRRIKRLMASAKDHEGLMASLGRWWKAALIRFDTDNDKHLEKEEFEQFISHIGLVLHDIGMECGALDDAWLRHAGTDGKIDKAEFLSVILEIVTEHTSRHDFDQISNESTRLFHLVFRDYFQTAKLLSNLSSLGHRTRKKALRNRLIKTEKETAAACRLNEDKKNREARIGQMQKSMTMVAASARWGLGASAQNGGWTGGRPAKGSEVEVLGEDGKYHHGVISGIDGDGNYEVTYDSGEVVHTTQEHITSKGSEVEVLGEDGKYHHGVISGIDGDGNYEVTYDSGEVVRTTQEHMRRVNLDGWGGGNSDGSGIHGSGSAGGEGRKGGEVVWYGSTGGSNRGLFTNMQPDSLMARPLDLNPTTHDKGAALGTNRGLCRSFHVRAGPGSPAACEGTHETTEMFRRQREGAETAMMTRGQSMMTRGQWLTGGRSSTSPQRLRGKELRKESKELRKESSANRGAGMMEGNDQPAAYSELIWGMQTIDHRNRQMQQWQRNWQQNQHSQTHEDTVVLRDEPTGFKSLPYAASRGNMRAVGHDQAPCAVCIPHKKLTSTFSSPTRGRPKKPFVLQIGDGSGRFGTALSSPGHRRGARPCKS